MSELYNDISNALEALHDAERRGNGIPGARTRLSNLLFNHVSGILENMQRVDEAEKELNMLRRDIESLQTALDDADAQYKELKASMASHKTK
jgi:chromosome segregation ATPase|nr:MAG TPA: protein of unknown function (DUF5320) [Caudoviricetes sp.]